ncbi:MAG: adenine nucleotide alpha hydrolase [Gammaproteobacteria bacterium]|nr:adenine nucleotide alpha hydrolase [Gammaproteobacteria bacterium]
MARCSTNKTKVILSWSSGKDSALALYQLLQDSDYEVVGLLTTVTNGYRRVSMHGVREELLELQATNLDLPLYKIRIPKSCSDEIYRSKMKGIIAKLEKQGVSHIAFGDLFLKEIRHYREQRLKDTTIAPLFPLWNMDTKQLAHDFVKLGFKAITTCIDTTKLPSIFLGNEFDTEFINKLPPHADPCGENGEFHTFVYNGPIFDTKINCTKGTVIKNKNLLFIDLI